MGYFMREHDIFIGTMLEQLNLRFAPEPDCPDPRDDLSGGIRLMAQLQKELKLFKKGRTFAAWPSTDRAAPARTAAKPSSTH